MRVKTVSVNRRLLLWLRVVGGAMLGVACALMPGFVVARALPAGQDALREGFVQGLWILRVLIGVGGALLIAWPRGVLASVAGGDAAHDAPGGRSWSRVDTAIVAALLAGAFALRLPGIGQSFTFDEVFLVDALITKNPIRIFFHPTGSSHALHTVFANFFVAVFGLSEAVVRLPALLAGTAAPAALYAVARYGSRWTGIKVGAILALTPCHVWYTQEAKGNAPLVLVVVLSWLCLCALQRRWRWRVAVGYILCLFLAGMSHLSGAVVVFGQLLAALLGAVVTSGDARRRCLRVAALHVPAIYLVAMFYAPILPFLTGRGETMSAIEGTASLSAVVTSVWRDFTALNVGAGYALALVPFFLFGVATLWRGNRLLLLNTLVPLALSLVLVKLAGLFSYSRYQMFFLPGLVLLVGSGIVALLACIRRIRAVWLREPLTALCVFVVAFAALGYVTSLRDYYARPKATFKGIAHSLIESELDLVVYVPGASKLRYPGMGFKPYLETFHTDAELPQLADTLSTNASVAVVVAAPMFLASSYPVLNQLITKQSFPYREFACHGELDQYRVQRSFVYLLPAKTFRNWMNRR